MTINRARERDVTQETQETFHPFHRFRGFPRFRTTGGEIVDWVPLWNKTLYSRKVQSLPGDTFKAWANCLLLANQLNAEGLLPPVLDLALALRLSDEDTGKIVDELISSGLLELREEDLQVHDWEQWQIKDSTSTERVRRFRRKNKDKQKGNAGNAGNVSSVSCNTPVTRNAGNGETPKRRKENRREEGPPTPLKHDETQETQETFHPVSSILETPSREPEWDRVANLAAEIGGDISWALWAVNRFKMGDVPKVIEAALSEAVNVGKINQQYVARIAARFAKDGIPEATASRMSDGKAAVATPVYHVAPKDSPVPKRGKDL